MFIIVGLGNPTPEYEGTRHNVGFEVIDALARKYNIDVECGIGNIDILFKWGECLWKNYTDLKAIKCYAVSALA